MTRRAKKIECWKINWRPEQLSATFHGRDLYAPVCAMIANGLDIPGEKISWKDNHNWPDDLYEIIYIDHFGNCTTGISDNSIDKKSSIIINGQTLTYVPTFSKSIKEQPFWYVNSNRLIEIAVKNNRADKLLNISIGNTIEL